MRRPRRNQALDFSQTPEAEKAHRHFWVGLDGEGVTLGEPRAYNESTVVTGSVHRYISMSWWDAEGVRGDQIEDRNGLSTKDCLGFILSIPDDAKIAAYGSGYDLTKLLEDLPADLLYLLTHPARREYKCSGGRTNHRPVIWEGFALDLFNTRFKVGRAEMRQTARGVVARFRPKDYRIVHDLSKFYQARFVTACKTWSVGTPEERDVMRVMKADRRNLIKYTQKQILDYSNKECQWLAELAQKLDDACDDVGANLKGQYFGAGSIAKALMRSWDIKKQIAELPPQIATIARYAFFGGRFELSRRGKIEGQVHDWDISAAYPYQIFMLPCLQCGTWSKTRDIERVRQAQAALCRYELRPWKGPLPPWGPFPFRDEDGTIPFPIESGGGWIHKDEFLAGLKLWPNVRLKTAWVYETACGHRPFEQIRDVYLERLRIGKEGPGIVLKLGANAVAGSIMQTIGTRPYHCPVWSGMITSGTRAQNLEMIGQHEKWSDVLMIATDGLWSLADGVKAPVPRDTGTSHEVTEKSGKTTRKPLGAWEHEIFQMGVFMARPGIYFPLGMAAIGDSESEKEDGKLKDLKARGIGIRTLYQHKDELMAHYERTGGREPYIIGDEDPMRTIIERLVPRGVERFVGLKSGVIRTVKMGADGQPSGEYIRKRDVYGLWTLQSRKIDFKALPKRHEGDGTILEVRRLDRSKTSGEYDRMKSKMSIEDQLMGATEIGHYDDEQDDWSESA